MTKIMDGWRAYLRTIKGNLLQTIFVQMCTFHYYPPYMNETEHFVD